jgi:hypothetical protein
MLQMPLCLVAAVVSVHVCISNFADSCIVNLSFYFQRVRYNVYLIRTFYDVRECTSVRYMCLFALRIY